MATTLGDVKPANWITSSRRQPKGSPTRSQVLRAQRDAVGGRRKRCKRGKNCSAACIQAGMVCLVEFPLPVQQPLGSVRDYLMKKHNIRPGSVEDKRLNDALTQLSKVVKEEKTEPSGKPSLGFKSESKRSSRVGVPFRDIQDMKNRRDLLNEAEVSESARRNLWKDSTSRGLRLPRTELEMIHGILPKDVQESLRVAGRATGQWYNGTDANGNPIFSKNPTKERALAVLDLWFRQAGTDGYLSKGGKIWAPKDLSIEHIVPLSKGGKDVPSNWILVRTGANTARQSESLGRWIDKLPKNEKEYKKYLSNYSRDKRASRTRKARLALVEPKNLSDREMFAKGGKSLAEIFRAENGGKTPSIFTKGWLGVDSTSTRTGNAGPPAPFAKALGMIAKTEGLAAARTASLALRKTWNDDWKGDGSITKQQAYQDMVGQMRGKLTSEQFENLFLPSAQSWAKTNGFL